jgi:HAE1 family hydrophobic/amphiphilic exporter-1
MSLIDLAVRRRVTVLMCTVAVLLFGAVSLQRLKLDLLPDLSYPTLTVRTELPGAAPLEVENLVTKPVEEAVGIIRNVRQVRSVSRSGQSDVVLEFAWGTDMDLAGIEVREKIDLLQLPLEARRPLLLRFDPSGEPVIRLALLDAGGTEPAAERLTYLRRFAEDRLKPDLESVDGSAAVKVSGGYEDEVQVLVDQQKLAQVGLAVDTVARRLRQENVNLSGGRLEQGTQRFLVRTLNEYASVEEMANAILATRDGRPVYLKDVATVLRGHKDREAITRVDGREAIELAVYKEGDANVVRLAEGVRTRLDALQKALPDGTRLATVYDQSHFIRAAIGEVRESALIGGLLAILVLYCFLRDARMTLISGVAIPVSVVGTFVLMYSADVSLNIMSLGGIALAVGMLVDNAVVVLESIVRRREHGASRAEAAREGAREVSTAVTAATLTSIAVFFPMVFITGIAGQLFRDQALTVTFSLALSLVVALTLVPMLAAGRDAAPASTDEREGDGTAADAAASRPGRIARAATAATRTARRLFGLVGRGCALLLSPLVRGTQAVYSAAERAYPPAVRWALAHRRTVLGGAFALFVGTLALVPLLGTELIPQMSQGEFDVELRLAPGTPLERTDEAVVRAQQAAAALGNVAQAYSVAGTGNRLDATPVDAGENAGKLSLRLEPGARRADEEAAIGKLRGELDRLPGVQYQFARPGLFTVSSPLEVVVTGHDLDQLKAAGESIRARVAADARFADVKSTVEAGTPEIQIVFDQDRAAQLGLTVRDVADRVVAGVRGEVATRWQWRDRKIDVLVRSVDTRAASIDDVRNLIVNPGAERPVPLSAIADVRLASGPAEIRRAAQERVAIVSANLASGDLGAAVEALERIVAATPLPAGVGAFVSGQSEEMNDSFRSLQFVLLLAIFLVYVVMASQFESLLTRS